MSSSGYTSAHRARWLMVAALAAIAAGGVFADATIGAIEVNADAELTSESRRGEKGITVRAAGIEVTGHAGRSLRFVAVAWMEGNDNTPLDYLDERATETTHRWGEIRLELPYAALQEAFGAGSHDFYVVFYIIDVKDGVPVTIPGSYHVRPVSLELQMTDIVDRHLADRLANHAVLESMRSRGPQYAQALEVAERYDLTIGVREFSIGSAATRRTYSWKHLTEIDDPVLDRYMEVFVREWTKLPEDFVRATGLRGVIFVKNLSFDGVGVGGGFDVDDRFVLCEVSESFGDEEIMHTLLHEYMHIIDNLLCCRDHFDNESWRSLNHPAASYSRKGALDMIREDFAMVRADHPSPGFLNGYCRADIYQDKAEVFSYLFVDSLYARAARWMEGDRWLAAKFDFMMNALGKLSPAFDERYFRALHTGR